MECNNSTTSLATSCFTCLRHAEECLSILDSVDVADLLIQHFWFQQNDFSAEHSLCQPCWNQLVAFHRFYQEVKQNHLGLPLEPNCVIKQENKEPYDALNEEEEETYRLEKEEELPFHANIKVENLVELEDDSEEEESEIKPHYLEVNSVEEKLEKEPQPAKRSYKKRQKTEQPVAKPRATYTFKTTEQLAKEDEIIQTHLKYICEMCGNNSPTFIKFQKHMENEHGQKGAIVCCGKRYHKKVRLLEHVQRLANPDLFKCDICQKSFINNHAVQRHKQEMHIPDEQKPFRCDRCPKRFAREAQLAYHLKGHENLDNQALKCPECDRIFETEAYLKMHIKVRHTRPTDFICDVCAKGFYSKAEFLRHKQQHDVPANELRVQCDICKQWLKNELSWRKHYRRHKQVPVACDLCGHVSPNKTALAGHKRHQHRDGNQCHTCQECGKQYKRAIGLREHMATHTGEALYSCSFCDRTFNSNANMFSHRKKMHPQEWMEFRNAQLEAQQGVVSGQKEGETTGM